MNAGGVTRGDSSSAQNIIFIAYLVNLDAR
jgi:hypothetical protein